MSRQPLARALCAAVAVGLAPAGALAATQTLFDATLLVPPSTAVNTPGFRAYDTPSPFVVSSRGTLTASISPGVFGSALQNLSFNLMTSQGPTSLRYSGATGWSGSLDIDPGSYFMVASGTTAASPNAFTPLGFFGVRIEFSPSDAAVVPLPAAGVLLAGALGVGALFGRRRRAAEGMALQPDRKTLALS